MTSNIFQVIKSEHLTEILDNNTHKIVIVMFSSKSCKPCKEFKPTFISIAKQNLDCLFLYIDILQFDRKSKDYIEDEGLESTPTFVYYFNNVSIAKISGGHEKVIKDTLTLLKEKIEQKKQEIAIKEAEFVKEKQHELKNSNISVPNAEQKKVNKETNVEILTKKIDVLNKLRDLANLGIILNKPYNIESDLEEMVVDYNFYLQQLQHKQNKTENIKTLNNPPAELNTNKKEEQLKQIRELNKVNQILQMQQLYKLNQLKQLQKIKEQQEQEQEKQGKKNF